MKTQSRVVAAKTTAGAPVTSAREMLRRGLIGLLGALALLGILSLFVDFRGVFRAFVEGLRSVDPTEIETDATVFDRFFSATNLRGATNPKRLFVALTRAPTYPVGPRALETAWKNACDSLRDRLALEAIARGYVRCEIYDPDGQYIATRTLRIRGLETSESIEVVVGLPDRIRIASVRFTY